MAGRSGLLLMRTWMLSFFLAKKPTVVSYSPAAWVVMVTCGGNRGALGAVVQCNVEKTCGGIGIDCVQAVRRGRWASNNMPKNEC